MLTSYVFVAAVALTTISAPARARAAADGAAAVRASLVADTTWTAGRVDTLSGVAIQLETRGTRARLRVRNTKDGTELVTPDVAGDSLAAWANGLEGAATAKQGTVSSLGNTIAASNASSGGTAAIGLFFGDAMSDRMLQFAVTPADARRLATLLRGASPH